MASALCHSEGIERVKWGNSRSERAPSYPFRLLSERNGACGMTSKAGAINSRHLLRVLEELADEGASGLLTEEAKLLSVRGVK